MGCIGVVDGSVCWQLPIKKISNIVTMGGKNQEVVMLIAELRGAAISSLKMQIIVE